jgi:hypothetical protein
MSGLVQLLSEMKRSRSSMKLATKHAILSTIVNDHLTNSLKHKAWFMNIHPRNITMAMKHMESMRSSNLFLWGLSIRSNKSDILAFTTKAIILSWWCLKFA